MQLFILVSSIFLFDSLSLIMQMRQEFELVSGSNGRSSSFLRHWPLWVPKILEFDQMECNSLHTLTTVPEYQPPNTADVHGSSGGSNNNN